MAVKRLNGNTKTACDCITKLFRLPEKHLLRIQEKIGTDFSNQETAIRLKKHCALIPSPALDIGQLAFIKVCFDLNFRSPVMSVCFFTFYWLE